MMIYILRLVMILSVICGLWTADLYAKTLSSNELIENAAEYDDKEVTYQGEVIGEVMNRGEYVWVNLNDGVNAIGIWAPEDMIKDIKYKGTYRVKGDLLEVRGVFHRSCVEHGGDLDIHAEKIIKIKEGRIIDEPLDVVKKRYALIFGIIMIFIAVLNAFVRLFRK